MGWQTLKAAEWLPDQPDFENPGATVANNCFAGAQAYRPINAAVDYSDAILVGDEDYMRGGISIRDANNVVHIYAGTAGNLYEISATAWDDISVAGAYSGTSTDSVWNFSQYSPSLLIATKYQNAPQKIVPGSNAVALGGSPPRAKYVAQIGDFVVLAFINDGTERPNYIMWSGFNNAEIWPTIGKPDLTRQADYQELFEGGWITGIVAVYGQGLVFQEDAVQLLTYTGPPTIFSVTRITTALGCKIPGSIISHRDRAYWWSTADIWEYAGGQARPIATEKVSQYLFDDLDRDNDERVSVTVDAKNGLIIWAYPGANNVGGQPNKLLIYAWEVGKFTSADLDTQGVLTFLTSGYTLEGLDAVNASIDALTPSLDDDLWKGGQLNVGTFTAGNKLATLTGTPLTATIETAELRAMAGRHMEVTNARPLHEGGDAQIAIGTRALHTEATTWKNAQAVNAFGEANIRTNARFTRARLTMSGNWTQAIGVDLRLRESGTR